MRRVLNIAGGGSGYDTVKSRIIEPYAMSLELPRVRSGVFLFFYVSSRG